MSRDDFPPFGKAQGALSRVEARTVEADRGRPAPPRAKAAGSSSAHGGRSGRRPFRRKIWTKAHPACEIRRICVRLLGAR